MNVARLFRSISVFLGKERVLVGASWEKATEHTGLRRQEHGQELGLRVRCNVQVL